LRAGAPSIEGLGTLSVCWYNPPDTAAKSGVDPAADGAYQAANGEKELIPIESLGWTAKRPIRGALDDSDERWDEDEDEGGRRRR
jgi:hypothetical protein